MSNENIEPIEQNRDMQSQEQESALEQGRTREGVEDNITSRSTETPVVSDDTTTSDVVNPFTFDPTQETPTTEDLFNVPLYQPGMGYEMSGEESSHGDYRSGAFGPRDFGPRDFDPSGFGPMNFGLGGFEWGPGSFAPTGEGYSAKHDFTHAQITNAPGEGFGDFGPGDVITVNDLSQYYSDYALSGSEIEFHKFDGQDFYDTTSFDSIYDNSGPGSEDFYDPYGDFNEFNEFNEFDSGTEFDDYNEFESNEGSGSSDDFFFNPNDQEDDGGQNGGGGSSNSIPEVSNGSQNGTEDTVFNFQASHFTDYFTDSDGDSLVNIRIATLPGSGALKISGDNVVVGTNNEIALANISNLTYTPVTNAVGTITFTWQASDGTDYSTTANYDLNIANVNDAPVLTGATPTLTSINEDQTGSGETISSIVDSSISDVDSSAVEGVAIYATAGNGTWQYTTDGGSNWNAIGTVSNSSALLLKANDTDHQVRYVGDGENAETATFNYYAWDQTSGTAGTKVDVSTRGNATAFSTDNDQASITVTSVNDTPVITNLDGDNPTFTEGAGAIYLDVSSNAAVTDVDTEDNSYNGGYLDVHRQTNFTSNDVLSVGDVGNITVVGSSVRYSGTEIGTIDGTDDGTGTNDLKINLDADAGDTEVAALIQALQFNNTSQNPDTSNRTARITLNDGDGNSSNHDVTLTVAASNDAPVNSVPGTQTVAPNGTITFNSGNSNLISISDADAGSNAVKITLSSTNGTMSLSGTTGLTFTTGDGTSDSSMVFTGTVTNINTALNGMTYSPTSNYFGAAAVTLTTDDQGNTGGGALTDTDVINVSVSQTILSMSNLDGANGFVINGVSASDEAGYSVGGGGDINGDGYADIIIGAPEDSDAANSPGHAYVVFGQASGFSSAVELSALDGTDGFVINGEGNEDRAGYSVSIVGDMNGDDISDMVIGAWKEDAAYVVYGSSDAWSSSFNLSSLDGTNGFKFTGAGGSDTGGFVQDVGDVNGDGYADIIVSGASPNEAYVIFGGTSISDPLASTSLDGTNGFKITGMDFDKDAKGVSGAGDIDGDGYDDLVIGSHKDAANDGLTFVIYGKSDWSSTSTFNVDTDMSGNGFTLTGSYAGIDGRSGYAVSAAGDFNGDGYADFLVGAHDAGTGSAGETYLIYGDARGNLGDLNLNSTDLNDADGFIISGLSGADKSGISVSSAGDFNGDGYADLLIGAHQGQNGTDSGNEDGDAYILFGTTSTFSSGFALSDLNGTNGIVLAGIDNGDRAGWSVSSVSDINGDGFDDIVFGAYQGDPNGTTSGESYVVFGFDVTGGASYVGTSGNDTITITAANNAEVIAAQGDDTVTYSGSATDTTIYGGQGADTLIFDTLASISGALKIDGGTGTDILQFNFSGGTLDLTSVADTIIKDIERIDIDGTGNNTLTMGLTDVLEFSETDNDIYVDGSSGDTVNLDGSGWSASTTDVSAFGNTYDSYVNSAGSPEVVYVDTDITVNLNT